MPPRTIRVNRRRKVYRGPRKGYRTYRKLRYSRRKSYKNVVAFKKTCLKPWTSNSGVGGAGSSLVGAVAGVDQNIVYTFQLSDLPNYDEITKLYDSYKIKSIRLKFVPMMTSNDVNPIGTLQTMLPLHSVLDFSDTSALATLNDYMEYSTYKQTRGLNPHVRYLYPKQIQYAVDGGVSTLASLRNEWLRSESPGIDHLGVKVFIPANTSLSTYQVFATFYILAKNSK